MQELLDSLLDTASTDLRAEAVLLHLLLAFVLGQIVAWAYTITHHGLSYSRAHVHALILLSVIVTAVMLAIGNNLARAFGLFGALALIRFRTPIKDTRDTVYLFMAVAVGIAVGSRNLSVAVVGTMVLSALALYLHWARVGARHGHDGVLRFQIAPGEHDERPLRDVLRRYCERATLVDLSEPGPDMPLELAYQVRLLDPELSRGLIAELRGVDGVGGVSLLLQDEQSEV